MPTLLTEREEKLTTHTTTFLLKMISILARVVYVSNDNDFTTEDEVIDWAERMAGQWKEKSDSPP